jgi:hypothetical protein
MKTIKMLSIAFTVCLTLLACGGSDDDPTPTPPPTPPTPTAKGKHMTKICNMPADASEQQVELTGLTSQATHKGGVAKWLTTTLSTYTGGTPQVVVACRQNLEVDARQIDVTFVAANDTLVLTVRQAAYTGGGTDVDNPNETYTDQPAYSREY